MARDGTLLLLAFGLFGTVACTDGCADEPEQVSEPIPDSEPVTISIVGTNDLHGHVEWLPMLGGYLHNLREAREHLGGGVLLIDGGDMFQGTLESNLTEGAAVIRGYNVLGYAAATVGNHEFDFGPTGPQATPQDDDDNPRGALIDRAQQAAFPLLSANIFDRDTNTRVDWPGVQATTLVERAGIKIGIIGVSTEDTLTTTIAANVADLQMAPIVRTVAENSRALRDDGAQVVVLTAHAGGKCRQVDNADDLSSCDLHEEIFQVAEQLPDGTVDAIVAGHTHQQVAHRVNGIPIIESHCYGVAFGRVDLTVENGTVIDSQVFPTQRVCARHTGDPERCVPHEYEGADVEPSPEVAEALVADFETARAERHRTLGTVVSARFPKDRAEESALGNLLADLIRQAGDGDVGIMNGGGIRSALDPGTMSYGDFHEVFPFDNRFARVELTGAELADLLASNLTHTSGILSVSGIRSSATCLNNEIQVSLTRTNGRPVSPEERLTVITSDYVATGASRVFRQARESNRVNIEQGEPMRERLFALLGQHSGPVSPSDYFNTSQRRREFATRPLRCE